MSDWGAWDFCSVSCGTGTRSRKRTITKEVRGQTRSVFGSQMDESFESELCDAVTGATSTGALHRVSTLFALVLQGFWGC